MANRQFLYGDFEVTQVNDASSTQFTKRQLECFRLISDGKTDWEIGRILNVSPKTVNYHVEEAKERLDVSTRIQVVVHLVKAGLI